MNNVPNTEQRRTRVRLEAGRYHVEGSLTLPRDGYRSRVSDYLNATERGPFLSLSDVTVESLDDDEVAHYPFLAVSRAQIVFLAELDEQEGAGAQT